MHAFLRSSFDFVPRRMMRHDVVVHLLAPCPMRVQREKTRLFTLSWTMSSYLALLLHDVGRPCSVSWHHDKVKDTRSGISRLSLVLKYVIGVSRPSNLLSIVVLHARSVRKHLYNLENMCWHSLIVTLWWREVRGTTFRIVWPANGSPFKWSLSTLWHDSADVCLCAWVARKAVPQMWIVARKPLNNLDVKVAVQIQFTLDMFVCHESDYVRAACAVSMTFACCVIYYFNSDAGSNGAQSICTCSTWSLHTIFGILNRMGVREVCAISFVSVLALWWTE